mmetsp:Transcript_21361/g.44474  ORF Transcript_21361/g.44474 Transcript_21361/m.44474 type:complete len:207 (-) Transcript_21361:836-1456(-)
MPRSSSPGDEGSKDRLSSISFILESSKPGTTRSPTRDSSGRKPSSSSSPPLLTSSPLAPLLMVLSPPRILSTMGRNCSLMGMSIPSALWIMLMSMAHATAHTTAAEIPLLLCSFLFTRFTTSTTWWAMASCIICGHRLASVAASINWFCLAPFRLTFSRTEWAFLRASGIPFTAISSSYIGFSNNSIKVLGAFLRASGDRPGNIVC